MSSAPGAASGVDSIIGSSFTGNAGGGAGGSTVGVAGGTAGVIFSVTQTKHAASGVITTQIGQNGAASVTDSAGANVTWAIGVFGTGGAAGGSATILDADFAGGNITGAGLVMATISGGAGGGVNGSPGRRSPRYFYTTGGSGGGSFGAGAAGAGGAAGWGCGGGGGGGGATFGKGGDGGPGIVLIRWW